MTTQKHDAWAGQAQGLGARRQHRSRLAARPGAAQRRWRAHSAHCWPSMCRQFMRRGLQSRRSEAVVPVLVSSAARRSTNRRRWRDCVDRGPPRVHAGQCTGRMGGGELAAAAGAANTGSNASCCMYESACAAAHARANATHNFQAKGTLRLPGRRRTLKDSRRPKRLSSPPYEAPASSQPCQQLCYIGDTTLTHQAVNPQPAVSARPLACSCSQRRSMPSKCASPTTPTTRPSSRSSASVMISSRSSAGLM